jgi:hypothetical protein
LVKPETTTIPRLSKNRIWSRKKVPVDILKNAP